MNTVGDLLGLYWDDPATATAIQRAVTLARNRAMIHGYTESQLLSEVDRLYGHVPGALIEARDAWQAARGGTGDAQ